ncbi:hypothetical protein [Desulfogranum marinum]|uniref:hypothetical protein n=1 Tax=Desulfogranum marinum TaxID=453220 RepID=UPI0029C7D5B3|nr:hypothetical protein [Desulfogranum marinum]
MNIPNKKLAILLLLFLFLLVGGVSVRMYLDPSLTKYRATQILKNEVFPHPDIVPFTLYGNNVLFIPHKGLEIENQQLSRLERLAQGGFIKLSHIDTARPQYMHDVQNSVVTIELTDKASPFITKKLYKSVLVKACELRLNKITAIVHDDAKEEAAVYIIYSSHKNTPFASFSENCDGQPHKAHFTFIRDEKKWKLTGD